MLPFSRLSPPLRSSRLSDHLSLITAGFLLAAAAVVICFVRESPVRYTAVGPFLKSVIPDFSPLAHSPGLIALRADKSRQGAIFGLNTSMSSARVAVGPMIGAIASVALATHRPSTQGRWRSWRAPSARER